MEAEQRCCGGWLQKDRRSTTSCRLITSYISVMESLLRIQTRKAPASSRPNEFWMNITLLHISTVLFIKIVCLSFQPSDYSSCHYVIIKRWKAMKSRRKIWECMSWFLHDNLTRTWLYENLMQIQVFENPYNYCMETIQLLYGFDVWKPYTKSIQSGKP